jgi:hypothetical protein
LSPRSILLKLHAAGPQDAREIAQPPEGGDRAAPVAEVEATSSTRPAGSRGLWARVVESR